MQITITNKKVSDDLSHKTDQELYEMKQAGKIVYSMRKSPDGKYGVMLDGTVYELTGGTRKKIGMMNAEGKVIPHNNMSKRERSKMKRALKRGVV